MQDTLIAIISAGVPLAIIIFIVVKIKGKSSSNKKEWKSILVIDDDETVLKSVRPVLISKGYSVLTANSGEAGLKIIESQKPDLVLLDVILPGIKGREVCKKIKENPATSNIPVIFLTSKNSEDDIRAEKEAGGEDHITKPFHPKSLIKAVRKILG